MPKSSKSVKRNKPKFRARLNNIKVAHAKKEKRKKLCKSEEQCVKDAWDVRKTVRENLSGMGLAVNPNQVIPIEQPKRAILDAVPIEGVKCFEKVKEVTEYNKRYKKKPTPNAGNVISSLEAKVKEEEEHLKTLDTKQPLPHRDAQLCIYYLARYNNEDYKAMSRDPKNLFQLTPKQIENRIKTYKSSPLYRVMESV